MTHGERNGRWIFFAVTRRPTQARQDSSTSGRRERRAHSRITMSAEPTSGERTFELFFQRESWPARWFRRSHLSIAGCFFKRVTTPGDSFSRYTCAEGAACASCAASRSSLVIDGNLHTRDAERRQDARDVKRASAALKTRIIILSARKRLHLGTPSTRCDADQSWSCPSLRHLE